MCGGTIGRGLGGGVMSSLVIVLGKEGGFKSSRDLSPPCGETSAFNVSELQV